MTTSGPFPSTNASMVMSSISKSCDRVVIRHRGALWLHETETRSGGPGTPVPMWSTRAISVASLARQKFLRKLTESLHCRSLPRSASAPSRARDRSLRGR
jgi:hypothetical protein